MIVEFVLLTLIQNPNPFLRKNEVPVSGIPTIRVEIPYYSGAADGEEPLEFEEVASLGLWPNREEALEKCESSYESLLKRIQSQLKAIVVMKMEKCQLSGPHIGRRGVHQDGLPYTFYRYEAYVSFLQGLLAEVSEGGPVLESQ